MQREFNHDLLRIARQARGLSQNELSKKSGVSQANLSKLENELIGPTEEVLASVSRALEFPVEFFFQNERVYGLPVNTQYRRRSSVGQKAIDRLEAEVNIRTLHIRRLLDAVDLNPELSLPDLCSNEYNGGPEHIADILRRTWLVPSGPIRNLVSLVERTGCIVVHCEFAGLKVDGLAVRTPNMPPCILLNRNMPADRQRFSLAHELGHVVMHKLPTPNMEDEANAFASALLMPHRDIHSLLSGRHITIQLLAALKPVWRVSMGALLYRARSTGVITQSQSQHLWRQMSRLGYRRQEPAELNLQVEIPMVLPEIIRIHLENLGYSLSDLARALRSSEADLHALYPIPGGSHHLKVVH